MWHLALSTLLTARLFTQWTVEQSPTPWVIEEFQRAEIGGPTITGDRFLVASPEPYLQARSLRTGEVIWKARLDGVSFGKWQVSSEAAFGGDRRGNVYRIRLSDGAIEWKVSTKGGFFAAPLLLGQQIFIQNSLGTLFAFSQTDGTWLWQHTDLEAKPLGLWSPILPVVFQNLVLAGFPNGLLKAFDPSSGRQIWQEAFQSTGTQGLSDALNDLKAIAASETYLAASSYSGDLRVWKAQGRSKKPIWSKKTSLHAAPTIHENALCASQRDGRVGCFDLEKGFERWQFALPSGLGSVPLLDRENRLWVSTSEGEVFVFSEDGSLLARKSSIQSGIYNQPEWIGGAHVLLRSQRAILRRIYLSELTNFGRD